MNRQNTNHFSFWLSISGRYPYPCGAIFMAALSYGEESINKHKEAIINTHMFIFDLSPHSTTTSGGYPLEIAFGILGPATRGDNGYNCTGPWTLGGPV